MTLNLQIKGTPAPKQSARFRIAGKGKKQFVMSYQKKEVKDSAKNISKQILAQLPEDFKPFDTPLSVTVLFVYAPLKSWSKKKLKSLEDGEVIYKSTKPDCDNIFKGLGDAMEGLVYTNDSRIANMEVTKVYGFDERTEVNITELNTI